MGKYQHIREFDVKFCDVDAEDVLRPSMMLAYLEEGASSSAEELGFGYQYLKARNMAFMVTNFQCRFYNPIPLSERIRVVTWPLIPSYAIFGREYQIFSATGEKYVDATSRWCLADLSTGKILPSKRIEGQDYTTYNTSRALETDDWKIPTFPLSEGEMCFQLTVRNSEYDHNMHVNNTRYADYCFNCFTVAELKERRLSAFSIAYIRQCRENQVLRFFKKEIAPETYLVQGVNAEDEIVVQSNIQFERNA